MRNRSSSAVLAFTILALFVLTISVSGAAGADATGTYIVQMRLDPVVTYEGGVAGIPATKPAKGKKIDRTSAAVQQYTGHLNATHDQALARVGGAEKLYDYNIVFNGFAARLTDAQAAAIAKVPGVLSVEQDAVYQADTATTPAFLGLSAEGGIWSKLRGPEGFGSNGGAGENIIIGIIDSGITPESLSFTDKKIQEDKLGKVTYGPVIVGPPPDGWSGTCQTGEQWTAANCNNKLIGARYFNAGMGGNAGIDANRPWEFNSARDYNGHGTHTSSTSGGNYGVPATGAAAAFGKVSGIAPRARVAMYKALWSTQDSSTASGNGADLLAAVNTAVADGVDVINYSVSGSRNNFLDGIEVAFLNAANVGVFVSASAGNDGPVVSTVAHPSPWITTVAAETHDRVGVGSATIDGTSYAGASAGTGSATGQLVTFGAAGSAQRLCQLNTLTAAAAGKIVFCERGVNARVEKSFEVQRVGGIGMILVNPTANSLNADLHFVPSVHLQNDSYAAIEAAALAGKTASISGQVLFNQPAPFMAAFSSRGPLVAGGGDLLKPDLGAPGVDVLAAVAPPGQRGREFDLFSGTSMSAPHIAGIAALFKQLHPEWSPMAIKSALMTSATDVLDQFTGTAASDASALRAFAQGAGHVAPNSAMDPGLVYDSDIRDWFAFLCGATTGVSPATCTQLAGLGYSLDRRDMNTPSIAVSGLAGQVTVKRKVTNVSSKTSTYSASSSITGVSVAVSPSTLTLAPGETRSFEVTLTTTTAALNRYTAGSLTWSDGKHNVRIPVVARPTPFATQAEVFSNGAPVSWKVGVGYTGTLTATVAGLVPATQTPFTVTQDPDETFSRTDPTGTFKSTVVVPANTTFRTGVYEDAISPAGTDLDLFVYNGATQVGSSADGDSNEEVTIRNSGATPVSLDVYVHGFSTNGPSATGTLFSWLATSSAGNTAISGLTSPTTPGIQTHTATFSGLAAGTRYLGEVRYSDGTAIVGRTLLTVRTP
jgi:subtilisin family serine protease